MFCPNCKKFVSESGLVSERFCPYCNCFVTRPRVCPRRGSQFCKHCKKHDECKDPWIPQQHSRY